MLTIISHSIPFKDILNDISREMGTTYSRSCEEYILEIPSEYGSGSIKGINFNEGLGLLFYDCTFNQDITIKFIVNETHPLKFLFCEKGSFLHHFEGEEKTHKVDALESIIVASKHNKGHVLVFKAGVRTVINSLEINRAKFITTMDCEIQSLDKVLEKLFMDVKAKKQFYFHGDYSVKMADLFTQLNTMEVTDFVRTIFLHSGAYKLLTLQILEYHDTKSTNKGVSLLRKRDFELVKEAAAYIENDILDFKSVSKLAEKFGLNSIKLQNGFKEIYGNTVNEFVHNRRMDIAKNLITKTDLSFSEITYMVGLSSKSYFSKIFRDRYGVTPSEIRNKNKGAF